MDSRASQRLLTVAFATYAAASLLHFAHNAALLHQYPNMPPWLTPAHVYGVWGAVTVAGIVGYGLVRARYHTAGQAVLGLYGAVGLDSMSHYARAPFASHTRTMNATIWLEFVAAAAFLGILGYLVLKSRSARELV